MQVTKLVHVIVLAYCLMILHRWRQWQDYGDCGEWAGWMV